MKPHVKQLRKEYQTLLKRGAFIKDSCCAKCSATETTDVRLELHHKVSLKDVDPESTFNPNTQDNLITLCRTCHRGYHVSYEDMGMDAWLTDVPLDIIYHKLQDYRDEKARLRLEHINNHCN